MTKFQKSWIILLLIVMITLVMNFSLQERIVVLSSLLLIYGIFLLIVSMNIRWNFFIDAVHEMPNHKIMLTFDDGPHPVNTPKILDILKTKNIQAMFFLIGKNVERHPEIVKRMANEGHQIGGHSYNHQLWFGALMGEKLLAEIMRAQHAIEKIIGKPVLLFRPPFGVTNPKIAKRIIKEGLKVYGWNARSYDSAIKDSSQLKKRIVEKITPGKIVLLHDPLPQTCDVLEEVLTAAQKKGYEFDVLTE